MPTVNITNTPAPSGNTAVIQMLLQRCVDDLFSQCPNHPSQLTTLRVTFRSEGPHTRHGGNSIGGYDIDLTAPNDAWTQHVYQFAHEAHHVLAEVQHSQRDNQWLEECLCEAGAIFSLQRLARLGPYPGLSAGGIPLHDALKVYADEVATDHATHDPGSEIKSWLAKAEPGLRADPNSTQSRECIGVIANAIVSIYAREPKQLGALQYLNSIPCAPEANSIADKLQNWRTAAPPSMHAIIDAVQRLLM